MAKKNNIRSIRFSDEIIEMIESQAGETFTAKFEALVTRCMWELPKKEKELECLYILTERFDVDYMAAECEGNAYELEKLLYPEEQANETEATVQEEENGAEEKPISMAV